MLDKARRTLLYSLGLLAALVLVLAAVGRHPPAPAPTTNVAFVGRWDQAVYDTMDDIANVVFGALAAS